MILETESLQYMRAECENGHEFGLSIDSDQKIIIEEGRDKPNMALYESKCPDCKSKDIRRIKIMD